MCMRGSDNEHRAFTLIELVVVIVVLAILSGVAIVKYHDISSEARRSADEGSLAGINEALHQKFLDNRMRDAGSSSWITTPAQVATVMQWESLPQGITVNGNQFVDQRGNTYTFIAETQTQAARIALSGSSSGSAAGAGGAGGSGGGSGGSGGAGGSGGSGGSGAIPEAALVMIALAPWLGRRRRGDAA